MSTTEMTFDQAVSLLRNAVKESHIKNQRHLDLSLIKADERDQYKFALMKVNHSVAKGDLSEADLKNLLGL
ncbi:MAG: hypothetical protein HN509_15335 [Halobacteriovoraceae bacterium]|jgi:hypothetical protein|nr:hypothetical protein [Halobacteriovoraceae bacterium]MBT5093176.1 hypothetical protein [Halobacteriovoraceae bacterium]